MKNISNEQKQNSLVKNKMAELNELYITKICIAYLDMLLILTHRNLIAELRVGGTSFDGTVQ